MTEKKNFKQVLPGRNRPSYTERGFRTYCSIKCTYGLGIAVQESSSAERRAVWICVHGDESDISQAAHLDVKRAKIIRDALNDFIDEETNAQAKE